MPPVLVWAPLALLFTSNSLACSSGKIVTLEKSYLCLSFGKSLKLKITQNGSFLFCKAINQIKEINGKSP
jgi:hypothetical protein